MRGGRGEGESGSLSPRRLKCSTRQPFCSLRAIASSPFGSHTRFILGEIYLGLA